MKNEKLIRTIGDINDKFILSAEPKEIHLNTQKKLIRKAVFMKTGSLLVAIAIVIGIFYLIPRDNNVLPPLMTETTISDISTVPLNVTTSEPIQSSKMSEILEMHNYLRNNLSAGMAIDEIDNVVRIEHEDIYSEYGRYNRVLRYDVIKTDDYSFNTQYEHVDKDGLLNGKISLILFIYLNDDNTLDDFSIIYCNIEKVEIYETRPGEGKENTVIYQIVPYEPIKTTEQTTATESTTTTVNSDTTTTSLDNYYLPCSLQYFENYDNEKDLNIYIMQVNSAIVIEFNEDISNFVINNVEFEDGDFKDKGIAYNTISSFKKGDKVVIRHMFKVCQI